MKTNYHERKQARLENAKRLSEKNDQDQDTYFRRSDELASVIPLGQPILVGHHSEKGHRSHLKKIHSLMDKGVEAGQKAAYYAGKAKAIENNTAISSDDPDAIDKLEDKLKKFEECQEHFKAGNKIIRNKKFSQEQKVEELMKQLRLSEGNSRKLLEPDFAGRIGFPSYLLQNNNANMARIKERISQLKNLDARVTTEEVINGDVNGVTREIRILSNVESNRVQIFFSGKPDEDIRKTLKSYGFRWAPTEGCWQRHLSAQAEFLAKRIVDQCSTSELSGA